MSRPALSNALREAVLDLVDPAGRGRSEFEFSEIVSALVDVTAGFLAGVEDDSERSDAWITATLALSDRAEWKRANGQAEKLEYVGRLN